MRGGQSVVFIINIMCFHHKNKCMDWLINFHSSYKVSQIPNNSFTPEVLKWNVNIISANLYVKEKLHFKLVLAKSLNVASVGIGGFSINGVIWLLPIWIIGKAVLVSKPETSAGKKSLASTSGRVTSKWKFFYKTVAISAFNGLAWFISASLLKAVLIKSEQLVSKWAKMYRPSVIS